VPPVPAGRAEVTGDAVAVAIAVAAAFPWRTSVARGCGSGGGRRIDRFGTSPARNFPLTAAPDQDRIDTNSARVRMPRRRGRARLLPPRRFARGKATATQLRSYRLSEIWR
jgi:hypothetical protein